jgi:HSP20 family protein
MLPIIKHSYSPFTINLLDELFDVNPFKDTSIQCPIHDVIENDKEFIVEAMLAGIKKEDVSVKVDNDLLTIKAVRNEVKDLKYNRKESFTGTYKRSFILPDLADVDNISATMEDGVLKVIVPKLEKEPDSLKKEIEIK